MSRILSALGTAAMATILASGVALAQPAPMSTTAPGAASGAARGTAATDRAAARAKTKSDRAARRQKEAECSKEAKAQKLHMRKRRAFMKECMARTG